MTQEREQELIKKYGKDVFYSGIEDFFALEVEKEKEAKRIQDEIIKQKINFDDNYRITRIRKYFDEKSLLEHNKKEFDGKELKIAREHGHKTKEDKQAEAKENLDDISKKQDALAIDEQSQQYITDLLKNEQKETKIEEKKEEKELIVELKAVTQDPKKKLIDELEKRKEKQKEEKAHIQDPKQKLIDELEKRAEQQKIERGVDKNIDPKQQEVDEAQRQANKIKEFIANMNDIAESEARREKQLEIERDKER